MNLHIANASGSLEDIIPIINSAFKRASKICQNKLDANKIDIIVVDASDNVIPEIGVGGYTPSSNIVYISLDSNHKIQEKDIYMGMLHEIHHAMRWRNPGYGQTLKEALLTEGLATLFEEEITGETPIYAEVEIDSECIVKAQEEFNNTHYNHHMWFISGDKSIPRWFGYAYGYRLAKEATNKLNKTASQLVNESIDLLI